MRSHAACLSVCHAWRALDAKLADRDGSNSIGGISSMDACAHLAPLNLAVAGSHVMVRPHAFPSSRPR
jgi:hypothetical protein